MKLVIVVLIALCATLPAQQSSPTPRKPLTNFDKLKDGDLVFIASNTPRAGLIQKLTRSEFSHCGIVFLDQGKPQVYEGAGANSDIHKPIGKWQTDESAPDEGPKIHLVYVRRLRSGLTADQVETLKGEAAKLHKTHYDFAFQMGDPKNSQAGREYVYCSELIYRAFQSLGVTTLGSPHSFRFYYDRAGKQDQEEMNTKLNASDVKKLRSPPGPYNLEEFVISPADVDGSDKLQDVNDDTPAASTASARNAETQDKAATPETFTVTDAVKHAGAADGSAGIAVGEGHFIGASDENNVLRLYSSDSAETGKELLDLNPLLGFEKEDGEFKECDIEGAAQMDDLIFWIGSHGLNKKGHVKESRRVLFATILSGSGADVQLTLKGVPCKSLMDALMTIPELKSAAGIKPEEEGGLNIESLCAKESSLLIGFRNPVSAQGALVVPLINPREVIGGKPPVLGQPFRLNLEGRGIRDMTRWHGQFLIVAGDYKDRTAPEAKTPKLFRWSGDPKEAPAPMEGELGDLNPEAALAYGQGDKEKLQLLSDDGGKSFRSVWVKMGGPP